jgi:hypothetical protein
MIRTGDTIENPITGERVTFLATAVDTDGEAVVIEAVVQPHGFVAAAHVHPAQSERFAVEAGGRTASCLTRSAERVSSPRIPSTSRACGKQVGGLRRLGGHAPADFFLSTKPGSP